MFPRFRADPAWSSRRKRGGQTQAPPPPPSPSTLASTVSPDRDSTVGLLSALSPGRRSSSNFGDEGEAQGLETVLYYNQLNSASSASSDYDEETALNGGTGQAVSSEDTEDSDSKATSNNNSNATEPPLPPQLEWVSNEHGRGGTTVVTGVPASDRPSTPVAGNRSAANSTPVSPSEAPPTFTVIPPSEVEDQTIINSDLAEAWFARRREHRMQQMLMYNPPQRMAASAGPMMDPRTGGFHQQQQQRGSNNMRNSTPPRSRFNASPPPQQPQQHAMSSNSNGNSNSYQNPHLMAPVDVDSGSAVEHAPPTAQAIVLRNPFEINDGSSSSAYPHFVAAANAHAAYEDSVSVVSRPNSLSSFPSTTTDMTPVVSNVTYPHYQSKYANSSYAASSSSANFLPSVPDHPLDQSRYPTATGGDEGSVHGTGSKGLCACCGSTGDRNSCKGFLDIRTYHGKLAILLVTILVLAIATMVVSATMTFQTNKNAKQSNASPQLGIKPPDTTAPTPSPTVLSVGKETPTTSPTVVGISGTRSPTVAPSLEPTPIPGVQVSVSPTRSPISSPPSDMPSQTPTLDPTIMPSMAPSQGPTKQPTPQPTLPPTPQPVTPAPTVEPTDHPTQALENFELPQVTTIPGPGVGSFFGTSVALSRNGHVLVVGAPEHNGRKGQVKVYAASTQEQDQWETTATLDGENDHDTFGYDVALSEDGSVLAVGASGGNGTVFTYVYSPNQNTYIPIGDPIRGQFSSASFGHSVALSEDGFRLVAGAPYTSTTGYTLNGQLRVYELQGNQWVQMGTSLEGGASVDWLGSSVDISGDGGMVIASAPRNRSWKGYVRTWTWNGTAWTQTGPDIRNSVMPAFSSDRFGHSIALSEGETGTPRVAIGSPWKTVDTKRDAGMVLVYEFENDAWHELGLPIKQNPPVANIENGNAVDLDGGILSVGIPGLNGTGAVVLYRFLNNTWEKRTDLIQGTNPGDDFGVSLSSRRDPTTDGFALVVGALMDGNDGAGYVASYVKQD